MVDLEQILLLTKSKSIKQHSSQFGHHLRYFVLLGLFLLLLLGVHVRLYFNRFLLHFLLVVLFQLSLNLRQHVLQ
jgi:hypothetical protein